MFFPRSFIWTRLGDAWFFTTRAIAMFALCCVLTLAITIVVWTNVASTLDGISIETVSIGFLAFSGVFAAWFLWGGMLRYWIQHDPSPKWVRRVWFPILLLGLCYGAILYYAVVYLPTTHERRTQLAEADK